MPLVLGMVAAPNDTALPHDWCVQVKDETGQWPYGFVWYYSKKSIWGYPYPLTIEAFELYRKLPQNLR